MIKIVAHEMCSARVQRIFQIELGRTILQQPCDNKSEYATPLYGQNLDATALHLRRLLLLLCSFKNHCAESQLTMIFISNPQILVLVNHGLVGRESNLALSFHCPARTGPKRHGSFDHGLAEAPFRLSTRVSCSAIITSLWVTRTSTRRALPFGC